MMKNQPATQPATQPASQPASVPNSLDRSRKGSSIQKGDACKVPAAEAAGQKRSEVFGRQMS